jgi:transposase-like protein
VLAKLPKSQQPKAKRALQEIWMAETKADAEAAFDAFIESYRTKYDKAAECLTKDRDALLTFYDFPAEHWKHLRTTNPIESTFATVRHRTIRSKEGPDFAGVCRLIANPPPLGSFESQGAGPSMLQIKAAGTPRRLGYRHVPPEF